MAFDFFELDKNYKKLNEERNSFIEIKTDAKGDGVRR